MDKTMSIVEGTNSNTQSKTRKSKNKKQSPFSPPRADSENATPWNGTEEELEGEDLENTIPTGE